MNGYEMMAETYRSLLEKGEMTKKEAESNIKVMDFLAGCSDDEIYKLFDSSAFNEIVKSYVRKAINNIEIDKDDDINELRRKIMNELGWLFSEKRAEEIIKESY